MSSLPIPPPTTPTDRSMAKRTSERSIAANNTYRNSNLHRANKRRSRGPSLKRSIEKGISKFFLVRWFTAVLLEYDDAWDSVRRFVTTLKRNFRENLRDIKEGFSGKPQDKN